MRKLTLSVLAVAVAALLASFAPRHEAATGTLASIDPSALTAAAGELQAAGHVDAH
jgi:hypothetical protein